MRNVPAADTVVHSRRGRPPIRIGGRRTLTSLPAHAPIAQLNTHLPTTLPRARPPERSSSGFTALACVLSGCLLVAVPAVAAGARLEPVAAAPEPASVGPAHATDVVPSAALDAPTASSAATAPPPLEPIVLLQPERPVPVYRTKIPPTTTLDYDIRRGSIAGTGEISWKNVGGRYEARLHASVIGYTLLSQVSQGGFDGAGLAPMRFTDQRARRAARAANFQRDAGKITFTNSRNEVALPSGTQDRLSWMIQLPAVLAGEPKRAAPGGEVVLYVAGARADAAIWTLNYAGAETVETAAGPVKTVKFTRMPQGPKDTRADVWLDPLRHFLPMRARIATNGDEDDAFELILRGLQATP